MKQIGIALILAAFSLVALAATPTANLSWTAVATDTNGNPLTGTVTYNVYQATQGTSACTAASLAKVQTGVTATTATVTAGLTPGSTQCFAVTAVANGVEGGQSNIATAAIPFPTPGAPSQLTVVVH